MTTETDEAYASPHPGLLHVEIACRQLGVSRPTLWRLIRAGELARVVHARKAWIPQSAITEYFARRIADASKAATTRRAASRPRPTRRTGSTSTRATKGETSGD